MNVFVRPDSQSLAAAWVECDTYIGEQVNAVWRNGFEVDDEGLSWWGEAARAAKCGDWKAAVIALLFATIREPSIYLRPYQSLCWAVAREVGVTGEAANGPAPVVTDCHRSAIVVPPPWNITPVRWASAHGSADLTASGALRIVVPLDATRNYPVTLPAVYQGAESA